MEHIHYNKLAPDCADDLQEIFSELSAILFAVKESGSGQDGGCCQIGRRKYEISLVENLLRTQDILHMINEKQYTSYGYVGGV